MFNSFSPILLRRISFSIIIFLFLNILIIFLFLRSFHTSIRTEVLIKFSKRIFPRRSYLLIISIRRFFLLAILNLVSLMVFSYPITTTLRFNLRLALLIWGASILFFFRKTSFISRLLPLNSPWYLIPFLAVIELVRLRVRPLTLCFRLLANISAGHILLSLICKIPYFSWILGRLFGVLELVVALVQAFVFIILCLVYFEESLSH